VAVTLEAFNKARAKQPAILAQELCQSRLSGDIYAANEDIYKDVHPEMHITSSDSTETIYIQHLHTQHNVHILASLGTVALLNNNMFVPRIHRPAFDLIVGSQCWRSLQPTRV
jgi:hypothetical protein